MHRCLLAAAGEGSHAAGCHGHCQQGPLTHWCSCAQEAESLKSFCAEQSRWGPPPDQIPCRAWPVLTKLSLEAAVFSRRSHDCSQHDFPQLAVHLASSVPCRPSSALWPVSTCRAAPPARVRRERRARSCPARPQPARQRTRRGAQAPLQGEAGGPGQQLVRPAKDQAAEARRQRSEVCTQRPAGPPAAKRGLCDRRHSTSSRHAFCGPQLGAGQTGVSPS